MRRRRPGPPAGRHAAWGVLFVLWPGFAYSLSLDTTELVAAAFLLGALLAAPRAGGWPPALLLRAVLTRDTTAVVPFGVGARRLAVWPTRRARPVERHRRAGWWPARSPLAVFAGWQLLQRARFGVTAADVLGRQQPDLAVRRPGRPARRRSIPPSGGDRGVPAAVVVGLVALLGAARVALAALVVRARCRAVAWLPAVAVVLVLNAYLWSGATAFMRAATEAGLLSILLLVRSAPRAAGRGGPGWAGSGC